MQGCNVKHICEIVPGHAGMGSVKDRVGALDVLTGEKAVENVSGAVTTLVSFGRDRCLQRTV